MQQLTRFQLTAHSMVSWVS